MTQRKIPCWIMRGGTSKAVFLFDDDIPDDPAKARDVLLRIFGSPDKRQIDGLGGADPLTSKCAVIGRTSDRADIACSFYQIGIETAVVKPSICGNIASAVGLFAVQRGLVRPQSPMTRVAIHDRHSDRVIYAEVPSDENGPLTHGDFSIAGVPGRGPRIVLDWRNVVGVETGRLLPTGHARDTVRVAEIGEVDVSIVDCGNPVVFVQADTLGLSGTELPDHINADDALLARVEAIRGAAAERVGLVKDRARSVEENPNHPFLVVVSPASGYVASDKSMVHENAIDIVARAFFMQRMHKTFPASAALCLGVATKIRGTILAEMSRESARHMQTVRIGHGAGVMDVEIEVEETNSIYRVERAAYARTARMILEGAVFVDVD